MRTSERRSSTRLSRNLTNQMCRKSVHEVIHKLQKYDSYKSVKCVVDMYLKCAQKCRKNVSNIDSKVS